MPTRVFMKLFQAIKKPFEFGSTSLTASTQGKQGIFLLLILLIILAFFNKSIISGLIPYPGDLIVANYEPYKSYSAVVPHKAQGPDVAKELIPWKHFVIESLKNGQIPFWNPHNFSGNPLVANFQSGVFYPANLLFFLFNFQNAWTIYIISSSILSSIFMYLFLRRLKLTSLASILGSISYTFSLYMTVWVEYGNIGHTLLWLPLVLFFVDRILEKVSYRDFLGLVVSMLLSILAGYIQGAFYIILFALIYFFGKAYSSKKISIIKSIIFILGLAFPVILSLFQLLPTLELFSYSTRGSYSIEQIGRLLNPVWYAITVVAPDFFGNPATRNYWFDGTYIERVSYFGLIPFVFAIFAILSLFKKTEVKIFSILFISTILLATDLLITKFFYLLPIPVITTTVPTRMLSLFAFSGSVLAAFGFDHFIGGKSKKLTLLISGIILISLSVIFIVMRQNTVAQRNLILPIGSILAFMILTFAYLRIRIQKKLPIFTQHQVGAGFTALILVMVFFDLYYYFQKITPFSPKEYMYPETPVVKFLKENAGMNRFWGYGSAYVESNFQTFDETFSPEGNDPLHIIEYTELLSASKTGRIPEILPRPDANVAPGFGKDDLANNPYRQKILNILGVMYILNKDETINGDFNPDYVTFPEDRYRLVWQNGFWQAYENLTIMPRYFITNKYVVVENNNRALRTLFDPEFNEQDTLILYEDPKIKSSELNSNVAMLEYSANKVVLNTNSNGDGLLYLSDNYYPGWRAYTDGSETKIFKANYAFRAVIVPSGEHRVVFEFKPKSFYYGLYAAFAAIAPLLYCSIVIKKRYG